MGEHFEDMDREENRKLFHMLWERAKTEDYSGLDDEQRRIAEALKLHADEFHNVFEFSDVVPEREFDPEEDEVNPFLHISMHAAVQAQLEARDPIEAFQFYNAMRKKKCSHHDSLHMIAAIMAPLMFRTMKSLMPFDNNRYAALLKKYKSRNPEKIPDLLDAEFRDEEEAFDEIFGEGEGPCGVCGTDDPVDEMGFCETCADKFERDTLRLRRWKYSITAAYTPGEEYEDLRRDVIEQFGEELEILSEEDLGMFDEEDDKA